MSVIDRLSKMIESRARLHSATFIIALFVMAGQELMFKKWSIGQSSATFIMAMSVMAGHRSRIRDSSFGQHSAIRVIALSVMA
jgi:hypothetical protein